jgi:hypothetical protein
MAKGVSDVKTIVRNHFSEIIIGGKPYYYISILLVFDIAELFIPCLSLTN